MDIIDVIENNPVPWTVAKFAAAMGVSTDQVYDLIKAGRLPALKLGSKLLLDPKRTADSLRQKLTLTIEVPQLRIPRHALRGRRARIY
jgi:excisionase family DNA binding protein